MASCTASRTRSDLHGGLSEIHLLKNLDLTKVHAMLKLWDASLLRARRFIKRPAALVGCGHRRPPPGRVRGPARRQGPHVLLVALPPAALGSRFMSPEGEDGDFANGPLALVKKRVNVHEEMEKQKVNEDFLGALTKLALDQKAAWAIEEAEAAEADAREWASPFPPPG